MTAPTSALSASHRKELAERLAEARLRLLRTVTTTDEELATLGEREPGAPIEDAAREEVLGILSRLEDQEQRELAEIEAARQRLRDGTYGQCESCGGSIPLGRLRAMPTARRCLGCQARQEGQPR